MYIYICAPNFQLVCSSLFLLQETWLLYFWKPHTSDWRSQRCCFPEKMRLDLGKPHTSDWPAQG